MRENAIPSVGNTALSLPTFPDLVDYIVRGFERDIHDYTNQECRLSDWTNSVFLTLRLHGQDRSYKVYCSDGISNFGEYLLDVIWFNPETYYPDLAVECEWKDNAAIAFDFEKLLWVKARLKVMICDAQTRAHETLPMILEKLRRYPDHAKDDAYLVIVVGGGPAGGKASAYVWKSPSCGKIPDATFEAYEDPRFTYALSKVNPHGS